MEKKYKIKLRSEKIVGPINSSKIQELYEQGHIDGTEMVQISPWEDWIPFHGIPELKSLILKLINGEEELDQDNSQIERELLQEFEISKKTEKIFEAEDSKEKHEKGPLKDEVSLEEDKPEETGDNNENVDDDSTKDIDLNKSLSEANREVVEFEKALQKIEEEKISKEEYEEIENEKKSEKKKGIIVVILALFVIYLLLDEKEEKKSGPVWVNFRAPLERKVRKGNVELSKQLFYEGMNHYSIGTYRQKIKASQSFRKSLEVNYLNSDSLGMLIRVYSELLPSAKRKRKASQVLFNLIKVARAKTFKSSDLTLGTSRFYFYSGKHLTALKMIENYLRVSNKPSVELFSFYLEILIETGDLIKAKKVFTKIVDVPNKPEESFLALAKFYEVNEEYKEAKKTILQGLKSKGASVLLRLKLADYFFREENFKNYAKVIQEIGQLESEKNPVYYSKFLEHMGMLSAYKKDNKKAVFFFRESMKFHNNPRLRYKLASLEIGGDVNVKNLVLESKIINLIKKSKKLAKERKWDESFLLAVEASDLGSNFVPSQINLANLQIKKGYFEDAISRLERIRKVNPGRPEVLFSMVKAFIASHKKFEAGNLINQISNSKLKNHPDYFGIIGRFYYQLGDLRRAVHFLNRSLENNPLRDQDYFMKAKIFIQNRQYDDARKALLSAIDLDPLNMEYHSLNAKIIYELSGERTAIGYLRNLLKENDDNPILLGDIAIFYYKSGQIKRFEEYKKKISQLKNKSPEFFRFLIKTALLEEKSDDLIGYSEKLLEIEPGDNEIRLKLGIAYMENKQYKKALESFNAVATRLKAYPTVYYHLAKVHLKMGNIEESLQMGKKEVEFNPRIYHGHYIIGEVHRLQGDIARATQALEKAVSLSPNNPESLYGLCWIKRRQNYLELALQYCRNAKNKDPSDPKIRRELGNVYAGIGQSELAVEEFQTYLNLYPNAPDRSQVKTNIRILKL